MMLFTCHEEVEALRTSLSMTMSGLALRWASLARDLLLVLTGSVVIALSAQVAVYLPFTPVPISGQTFAVLLVGAALGSRRGALAVLTYVGQGAAGLPVFAAGAAGLANVLGPRGGYLAGMVLAAYLVGLFAERGWDRHVLRSTLAMLVGNVAIYAVALPWLAFFVGGDLGTAFALGCLPFLVGDAIKIALAAGGVPVARGLIRR
jgi:biotin transport system substrate-specific component